MQSRKKTDNPEVLFFISLHYSQFRNGRYEHIKLNFILLSREPGKSCQIADTLARLREFASIGGIFFGN